MGSRVNPSVAVRGTLRGETAENGQRTARRRSRTPLGNLGGKLIQEPHQPIVSHGARTEVAGHRTGSHSATSD